MIETRPDDGVLEVTIANPPVNALGAEVRRGLVDAIGAAQADPSVRAVLIRGAGRMFSAGADITEFGKPLASPHLQAVVDAVEASAKPVVAALHGTALGGGLEIALACHYRVATTSARLGLPEVTLGILPAAGGTQRLPRLVGIEAALRMIVLGEPIAATEAAAIGLVDALVDDDDLGARALAFARAVDGVRRTGEREAVADDAALERFRAEHADLLARQDAPAACFEVVVAAAELPLAQGLAKERELFLKLVDGEQARQGYAGGVLALVDVLDADRALLDASDRLAAARAETARASLAAIRALGGGWQASR